MATADHMLPAGALSRDHFTLTARQKQVQLADGNRWMLAHRPRERAKGASSR